MTSGEVVAFGFLDAVPADGVRQRIPCQSWRYITKQGREEGTFGGGGQNWYRVLFYKANQIEKWEQQVARRRHGICFDDAILEYAEPELLKQYESLGAYDGPPPPIIVGDPNAGQDGLSQCSYLRQDMRRALLALIERGSLAMWAFRHPIEPNSRRERIPGHVVRLLDQDFGDGNALEGNGLRVVDIRIYPPEITPEDAAGLARQEAPLVPLSTDVVQGVSDAPPSDETLDSDHQEKDVSRTGTVAGKFRAKAEIEEACHEWLLEVIEQNPDRQHLPKDDIFEAARTRFRASLEPDLMKGYGAGYRRTIHTGVQGHCPASHNPLSD